MSHIGIYLEKCSKIREKVCLSITFPVILTCRCSLAIASSFKHFKHVYTFLLYSVLAGNSEDNCTHNETLHRSSPDMYPRCPEHSWLAVVFMAVYMMTTNVLLLNLLIAKFRYFHLDTYYFLASANYYQCIRPSIYFILSQVLSCV